MTECDDKKYTRILQNLLWRNISRNERRFIFFMNLFAAFPGYMYFITSVYENLDDDNTKPELTVGFLGKQTTLSVAILLITLVIIPIVNFSNQSRRQKFRFALRLSQSALFCAWINAIFYLLSLNEYMKERTRKRFKTRNEGLIYIGLILIAVIAIYTIINPEYDDIRDLSKEVKVCKKKHLDIRALSKSSNNILDS